LFDFHCREPDIRNGAVWRLLTNIILHAGILHILSNTFCQLRFGYTLELRWGWPKFVVIYLLTGISAALWSCVLSWKAVSVGASGALFGLVGADISYIIYNWREIPQAPQEACLIAFITIITFLFGIDTTVDNFAHLGGLISGIFAGMWIPVTLVKRGNTQEMLYRGIGAVGFWGLFLLFLLLLFVGNPQNKG
jgi:membrane associated rhomboid family serine protease